MVPTGANTATDRIAIRVLDTLRILRANAYLLIVPETDEAATPIVIG
jgi:hypothetical protein